MSAAANDENLDHKIEAYRASRLADCRPQFVLLGALFLLLMILVG